MNEHPKGVLSGEHGIQKSDGIYFYSASDFAKQNLFYLMWGTQYTCTPPYHVERTQETTFDSFLFFYIEQGEMEFTYREQSFTARTDDIVLLDCKRLHQYAAKNTVTFYWFHFNGMIVQPYTDLLWNRTGALFPQRRTMKELFLAIQSILAKQLNQDGNASVLIHQLFVFLSGDPVQQLSEPVAQAKQYIDNHFFENISVDDIASQVLLSRYHFSRLFRTETGTSPYSYLLEVRITYAKQQLTTTSLSIEEIAEKCVFSSSSNFIRTFKQHTGLTPAKFRRLFR